MCYFLPVENREPIAEDSMDRRASLRPEDDLAELSTSRLQELLSEAAPLTETERRRRDDRGRAWLIQNSGPVWAEGGVAAGLTGVVLTRLEGGFRRLELPGGHVGKISEGEVGRLLPKDREAELDNG